MNRPRSTRKPALRLSRVAPGLLVALSIGTGINAADVANPSDWPTWRGTNNAGVAESAEPPIEWSEEKNIRWKVAVPGVGSSTPIVLNGRVYVATAVKSDAPAAESPQTPPADENAAPNPEPEQRRPRPDGPRPDGPRPGEERPGGERGFGRGFGGRGFGGGERPTTPYKFMVIAYDLASGKEVWQSVLTEAVPHEAGHSTNNFASSSPLTDGKRLYVSFGSRGIFCLDLDGKQLWKRELGQMQTRNQFGEGSSPAVYDNTLVVPWDHEGDSFIVALDATTGEERWRVARDELTTWATPLITEFQGRVQVIANGSKRVRSYDLETGELIWECGGQAGNPIPTPVRYKDNVIVMTGFRGYAIYSIPLESKGDITGTDKVTWFVEDAAPYVPSPVLYQGQLYYVKSNNGVLASRSADDGDLVIEETRLPDVSSVYASPVAANDHIYLTGRDGTTLVLKHGSEMNVVATNKVDEEIDASAAITGNVLLLRSKTSLYCIAAE